MSLDGKHKPCGCPETAQCFCSELEGVLTEGAEEITRCLLLGPEDFAIGMGRSLLNGELLVNVYLRRPGSDTPAAVLGLRMDSVDKLGSGMAWGRQRLESGEA